MKITYDTYTDNGGRPVNEDSADVFKHNDANLFVVCDGLGGHGKGDTASQLVVRELGEYFKSCKGTKDFTDNAINMVHQKLLEEQKASGCDNKMKTTAVALVIERNKAVIVNIGDSRCYIFRDGNVYSKTMDQSVPQMLVNYGDIEEHEIRNHPDRNRLIYALGGELKGNEAKVTEFDIRDGDFFLLCTDGFWELITEFEMTAFLTVDRSPKEWLADMVKLVAKNGKTREMDNYTAIAVAVKEDQR